MGVRLVDADTGADTDLGDRRVTDEAPVNAGVPLAVLADQLTLLSAQLAAGEARFLELLEEFDRRAGWAQWGLLSCSHWLSWRCGIDLETARERVREARRLPMLPGIRAALAAGEVSYAKVRAMTRAATPENEETLLVYARHGTASHVEKIVSGFRKVVPDPSAAAPDGADRATTSSTRTPRDEPDEPAGASLEHHYDDGGALVITARFPDAEHGMVVLQALRAAVAAESPDKSPDTTGAPDPDAALTPTPNRSSTPYRTQSGPPRRPTRETFPRKRRPADRG